ncbi:MAG: tetratricopeptide repeat protein, partial [Planctomycetota bacterium]
YAEAEDLCSRALSTLENIFDENHPCVAEVLETMAQLQHEVGDTAEAAKLKRRVEEIRASKQVAYKPVAKAIE